MAKTTTVPVRPLNDRVLVLTTKPEEKTPGGLFIPQTANSGENVQRGKVVAVGTGRRNDKGDVLPVGVKVEENVMFSTFSGTKLELDGSTFVMLREDDIIGVLN